MDATPSTSEGTGVASPTESIAFAPPAAVPSTSKGKKATKRVLGADDEDEDGKQKKRNRKPVTCAQCRRRKLKCDRGYPCGACRDRQEGHLCEWEGAIRLPQPHLTRDAEAQELRGQLDRFENLLTALSTGQSIVPSAMGGANGASGSGEGDVGESGAAHLLSHLSANTANSSAVKISNSAARAQLLAQAQSVGHLVGLLPSRKELDILVLRFVSGEPNFLPVIHVPTFQKRYNDFSHSTATEEPFFLAFLFSIVSYEMGWQLGEMSLSKTAGVQKEGAMKRLFEASSEALRMAGYLESPNLDVVRTLIVLYHCASQQLDTRAGHLLTQAIQVAQSLGLNRDPQAAGITDQIQIQERRRLWYILVAYDSLEQPGRLSIISPERYDTLQAASAFDNDITETSVTTRPFPSFTPALYLNLLNDIANYNRLITQSFFSIKPKEQITWAKIVESNAGIDRLRESFSPLTWKNGLVEPLPEDQFSSDKFRVLAHTALLKLDIRVNRPFLTRGFADSRFKEGRTRTLDAAHQLLGIWLAYPDQSSVSRLWQLSYHGLNALCIIIVDLLQDPKGPRADSHRKFLAMSSGRLDRPEFKSKLSLAVTRVIGILTQHLGTPILPAYIASSTTLDPSESFAVSSLPLPLTIDPFAYISPSPSSEDRDPTLATAWHEIVDSYPAMYAVPDKYEWMELSKLENRWRDGIDLFVDQSIDQLEEE